MSSEAKPSDWPLPKTQSGPVLAGSRLTNRGASAKRASRWRQLINVAGPFFGLFLVIGLFSLSPSVRPYFLTGPNFKIILTQTVRWWP
jgi:hypothetical protein